MAQKSNNAGGQTTWSRVRKGETGKLSVEEWSAACVGSAVTLLNTRKILEKNQKLLLNIEIFHSSTLFIWLLRKKA